MKKVFIIERTYGGKKLYLHPLQLKKSLAGWDPEEPVEVTLSHELTEDSREDLLYVLYTAIDKAVDSWIQELKYIPRFINSAVAFTVLYFFFSLVIRDPIPLLDELLLAGGGAVALYFFTAAKNRKSDRAMKMRVEVKEQMGQYSVVESLEMSALEELLKKYDETPTITLSEMVCGNEGGLDTLSSQSSELLIGYLGDYLLKNERHKKILRKLDSVNTDREKELFSAYLMNLSAHRKIDLPLLSLYLSIRK